MDFQDSSYRRIFSSDAFATLVVCSAVFTDAFIYDLIIPFLPQMLRERIGISNDRNQFWTSMLLSVFGVSFLFNNLIVGALADWVRSKRLLFSFGIIVMIASSLLLFLGTHIVLLVVARGLQGFSASIVWVSGFAFLTSHIDKKNIGWAMGMSSVGMGAGEILGPSIGGVMYEHVGHFAVLGLVCAILGVDITLRLLLVDKLPTDSATTSNNEEEEERPLLQNRQGEQQSTHQDHETSIANKSQRLATINVFSVKLNRDLCASCYAIAINSLIVFSLEATIVNFVSQHFGWSTSASGGIIFAFVSPTLLSPLISGLTMRYGPRWSSILVFTIGGGGLIGLGFMTRSNTITKVFFVIVIVIIGSCTGTITTIHHIAFGVAMKKEEQAKLVDNRNDSSTGRSFGSLSTAWAVGTCVGPSCAALFLENFNWLVFCISLASLSFMSAIVMVFTWKEWEDPSDDE